MKEYRVTWQACPHVHHPVRVLFVEAGSVEDAQKIARNHVERNMGLEWFTIKTVTEAEAVPAGSVKY